MADAHQAEIQKISNMLLFLGLCFVAASLAVPAVRQISCYRSCHGYAPVCGSDHQTYTTPCALAEEACKMRLRGHLLYQRHNGRCNSIGHSVNHYTCNSICDEDFQQPVCASDGVVYPNRCRFTLGSCAAHQEGDALHIVSYTDTCPIASEPKCEVYSNIKDLALEIPQMGGPQVVCPQNVQYVCTTMGTFINECQFCLTKEQYIEKAKANPNMTLPDFQIWFHGRCGSNSFTTDTPIRT